MLVLSRHAGERICLTLPPDGREVWIEVSSIDRTRGVQIAIDAPRDVLIAREEIYRRNHSTAGGAAPPV